jgi:hypothetical protein
MMRLLLLVLAVAAMTPSAAVAQEAAKPAFSLSTSRL